MPSDDASLTRHLDTLYPLACVLAGPDAADTLLRHAYERAAETPPDARPEDTQGWLLRLLVDTRAQAPDPAHSHPRQHAHTLRRDVAERTVARVLPVAFAAGSEEERLVLTLDVLDAPIDTLAQALNTPPDAAADTRSQAWSALQDRLRNSLHGPERALVEETMSQELLRSALREDLTARFQSPPASLRSVLNAIEERAEEQVDTAPTAASPSTSPEEEGTPSGANDPADTAGGTRRRVFGGVLLLVVAIGIAYGVSRLQPSSPPSSTAPDLPSLSARAADTLRPTYETADPAAAQAFIRTTWQRRIATPSVTGATLQGVGVLRVGEPGVPAFVFAEDDGTESITVLAFSYAVVDQLGDQVQLDASLRDDLAENEAPIPRTSDGQAVVLWRHRADILVAVAPHLAPDALRSRLVPQADSVR